MHGIKQRVFTLVLVAAMAGILACGEKAPPAPQSQVARQKIGQPQAKPAAHTPAVQKPAVTPKPETQPEETADQSAPPATDEQAANGGSNATVSALIKESMALATGYDPKGRFDPFEPLFKDEPSAPAPVTKAQRKKRVPQTPLERVAISQLKLSAIMRTSRGNSAIVEDATGKGYVIHKGTYIGLNSGQVTKIDKDHVEIEEEIENVMGEPVIQNTELKLQKPAGEL